VIELPVVMFGPQVVLRGFKSGLAEERGNLLHDLPGQHLRVVGLLRGLVAQHRLERLVAEGARERKPEVAADAVMLGQLKLKPASHPLALHQDGLRLERRPERPADTLGQGLGQALQPVAGV